MNHSCKLVALAVLCWAGVARTAMAAEEQAGICGVKLGALLATAEAKFTLHKVGSETFKHDSQSLNAVRWEGKPRLSTSCIEVRPVATPEPNLIISIGSKSGRIIRLAHRTIETDCKVAEKRIAAALGTPATTQDEVVEWNSVAGYRVVLTRYNGEDCWLSYISKWHGGAR